MRTERLEIRLPQEADRSRFVELFGDDAFMVFAGGTLDREAADARFDSMLRNGTELPFAKQPVIERATQTIVGYVGVDRFDLEGREWLELGWRLVPEARGRGFATEAARAVLGTAARTFAGELLVMIDPRNEPSHRVAQKVGFTYWKRTEIEGDPVDLYRLRVPC